MDAFTKAFAVVVGVEAGLSLDPHDPGNWSGGAVNVGMLRGTKYGISAKAYPLCDIANLQVSDAQAIYRRDYWNAVSGDALPYPLSLLVFDCAVNQGVRMAKTLLQTALRVVVDGVIGPKTIAAAQASTVDHWAAFMTLRAHQYEQLSNFDRYGDGWTNRMFKVCLQGGV